MEKLLGYFVETSLSLKYAVFDSMAGQPNRIVWYDGVSIVVDTSTLVSHQWVNHELAR